MTKQQQFHDKILSVFIQMMCKTEHCPIKRIQSFKFKSYIMKVLYELECMKTENSDNEIIENCRLKPSKGMKFCQIKYRKNQILTRKN